MSIGSPDLLEEHQKLQDGAIEFAQSELGADIIRRDREEEFSVRTGRSAKTLAYWRCRYLENTAG